MIVAVLIAGDLLLALLCIGNHFLGYPFWPVTRLLHLSGESNIPTWFTSLQLAGVAWCGLVIAADERRRRGTWPLLWLVVAVLFAILSLDEVACIHEEIGRLTLKYYGESPKSVFFRSGVWMLTLGPAILVVTAWLAWRLVAALKRTRKALVYTLVGLGLYVVSAAFIEILQNFLAEGRDVFLSNAFEETGEMIGTSLMVGGLLTFIVHGHAETRPSAGEA